MQNDPRFFTGNASPSYAFDVGDYTRNTPSDAPFTYGVPGMPSIGAAINGKTHDFPRPSKGVELQPTETCPKNFVIFDHTDNRSRIMFHPALAHKFSCPSADGDKDDNQEDYSYIKEETEDINALLGSEGEGEEDEDDDDDDDVVSTGRTLRNWGGTSPDSSCSSLDGLKFRKLKSAAAHEPPSGGSSRERKRERTRKMVKALRGIIPGGNGNGMDTPAVLDEAIRYLKSLKMEARKLGIQNVNN